MRKLFAKRFGASVMSAAMVATCLSSVPAIVWAASDVPVNETLECADSTQSATGEWVTSNKDDCTYVGYMKQYPTSGITSLQFNFTSDVEIAQFDYYFGISSNNKAYWWDKNGENNYIKEGSGKSFSITIDVSSAQIHYYDNEHDWAIGESWNEDLHMEFQNAYAADMDGNKASVKLTSVTVNGKKDDTSSTAPEGFGGGGEYEEVEPKNPNTGGRGYSSQNLQSGNYTFKDNKDGTATITATITKKITAEQMAAFAKENYGTDSIVLTPSEGENDYSQEAYVERDENGKFVATYQEESIRKNGNLLNSHKFFYKDFGIEAASETAKMSLESLTVALRADEGVNVTRVQYGAGVSVIPGNEKDGPMADTEYAKRMAGLKEDPQAGYWYNDAGQDVLDRDFSTVDFGVEVGNGGDIKEDFGDYVEVTWDVPKGVGEYTEIKPDNSISFQLWYGEIEAEEYTTLEHLTLESAEITYTQEHTFPYHASSTKSVNQKISTDGGKSSKVRLDYADFNLEGKYTDDVYAILYTFTTDAPISEIVFGGGTSVRADRGDWYQFDEDGKGSSITILNADDSKKEYTFMWLAPVAIAATSPAVANYINAEDEGTNFEISAYYAGNKGETVANATIKDVTVYYAIDDRNNQAKQDKFEKTLSLSPKNLLVTVGDTKKIVTNVEGTVFTSSDPKIATVDEYGNVTGVSEGKVTIKGVTPQGQEGTIEVTVNPGATTVTTTVTTTTTKVTTTTEPFDPTKHALYGDVNVDGKVDLRDAVCLARYLAKMMSLTPQGMENAQCEYDGIIDDFDLSKLLQFLVLLPVTLGPTK